MKLAPQGIVKSAERVIDILELIGNRGRGMSHSEIAAAIGIPKSSLTQLLRNLEARRYLHFVPGPNTFELGPAVLELSRKAHGMAAMERVAQSLCEKLTKEINESSSLNMLRDNYVERVCGANSFHTLQIAMNIGDRAPLHAVSSGKAILAYLPAEEREALLKLAALEKVTDNTVTSVAALRKELSKVTQTGIAYSKGEFTPGIVGIAVPVRNTSGHVIGALNVAMPEVRFNAEREGVIVGALRRTAGELEAELRKVR